jgi:plasmid stabilization system protein ParE
MSSQFIIGAEAQADIAAAVKWLNNQSTELPARFRSALEDTLNLVSQHPQMFPVVHRKTRRALLSHFPYSVFYVVGDESILILGVIHQARHPSVWKRRSPN